MSVYLPSWNPYENVFVRLFMSYLFSGFTFPKQPEEKTLAKVRTCLKEICGFLPFYFLGMNLIRLALHIFEGSWSIVSHPLQSSGSYDGNKWWDPKLLSHFFFALKQSKANKCQYAKRLKTVKKLFFKFFVKEFWKNWESERGGPPGGRGVGPFWKNCIKSNNFFVGWLP